MELYSFQAQITLDPETPLNQPANSLYLLLLKEYEWIISLNLSQN